jgi:hypothetical protein
MGARWDLGPILAAPDLCCHRALAVLPARTAVCLSVAEQQITIAMAQSVPRGEPIESMGY